MKRFPSIAAVALIGVFLSGPAVARARPKPSTPTERRWAVETANHLAEAPLMAGGKELRARLLQWWMRAPDLELKWCADVLSGVDNSDEDLGANILLQGLFSAGAFVIERPDKAADRRAVTVAGVDGALRAYRSILEKEPERRSPFLDDLLKRDEAGTLGEYVDSKLPSCK